MGSYILALATVAALLSSVGYLLVARGNRVYVLASRWSYYMMTGLLVISVAYLLNLLINNHFEYSYITSYSSIDLPVNFKITSLWAGQEGSFLLWLFIGALLGLWVNYKAKEHRGWVMFFYLMGQLFLFTLLMISTPFKLNPQVLPDGQGLNPLLQNFWMQIHPPIMFMGYAATFVPFSFAMAALASGDYKNWVKLTFPWAIFSVCSLGAGIFIGGYWAYETLGWGGFWGWDPVENASLVPWLGSIALVHGMILERVKGTFKKTNLFMAITVFLMVIYGTFLTRSGVLADFSVHSFVDLGYLVYLVIFLVGFAVISYGLLAYRSKSIRSAEPGKAPMTREFTIFLGMLFLIISAFLVLLGTSSPLLTRIFGNPAAVDISYYTLTNLPIGIILGIVIGLAGLLSWRVLNWADIKRKLIIPVTASLTITIVSFLFGVYNPVHLLFILTSAFAFVANLIIVITRINEGLRHIHGDIIHAGFALMLIGVVVSSAYSPGQKAYFALNETEDVLGFNIKYAGSEFISKEKQRADLVIERGSSVFTASPIFFWSRQGLVRTPFIKKFLFYDLYISPEEIKSAPSRSNAQTIVIAKGQTETVGDYKITFEKFDLGSHTDEGVLMIGAVLNVETAGGESRTVKPMYVVTGADENELLPAQMPSGGKFVYLLKMSADEGLVHLGISDKDTPVDFEPQEIVIIDVSIKPLINFVWLGLILIVVGSGMATYRRIRDVK